MDPVNRDLCQIFVLQIRCYNIIKMRCGSYYIICLFNYYLLGTYVKTRDPL